jgi:hypothetical protein
MKKLEGRNGGGPKAFSSSRYCRRQRGSIAGKMIALLEFNAVSKYLQGEDEAQAQNVAR